MRIDLNEIWRTQEEDSGKHIHRQRINQIAYLDCYAGLNGLTGARMFQLEISPSTNIHLNYLRKFRGVTIQIIPYEDRDQRAYTIILLEKELTDIFSLFIEDIVEKLLPITSEPEALTVINFRVAYWKKLFGKVSGELLSQERQRGLYGELAILKLLLNQCSDHQKVLNSWQGTSSSPQDFSNAQSALEVKTSKALYPKINISNELQLDYTYWDNLHLSVISINETHGSGSTLMRIIEDIKRICLHDTGIITMLDQKLDLAGIPPDSIDQYNEIGYIIRNCKFYEVREGFPLINGSSLNNSALSDISYRVDISSCSEFETTEEKAINTLL